MVGEKVYSKFAAFSVCGSSSKENFAAAGAKVGFKRQSQRVSETGQANRAIAVVGYRESKRKS